MVKKVIKHYADRFKYSVEYEPKAKEFIVYSIKGRPNRLEEIGIFPNIGSFEDFMEINKK